MGASNFARLNSASKIFAVLMDATEMFEIHDFRDNIQDSFNEIGFDNEDKDDDDRNYNSHTFASKSLSSSFGDADIEIKVDVYTTSGYYEGANLDYDFSLYQYGQWNRIESDLDEEIKYCFDNSDMNKGMQTIQARNAHKWAEKLISELSTQIENIFEQYAEHELIRVGGFSDGTSVYEEVKK